MARCPDFTYPLCMMPNFDVSQFQSILTFTRFVNIGELFEALTVVGQASAPPTSKLIIQIKNVPTPVLPAKRVNAAKNRETGACASKSIICCHADNGNVTRRLPLRESSEQGLADLLA